MKTFKSLALARGIVAGIILGAAFSSVASAQQLRGFDENEYYREVYSQCRMKYDFDRWNQSGQEGFYRWQSEFRAELLLEAFLDI